jgi:glutamine cyclotransferase
LDYADGQLYESVGLYGHSALRQEQLTTGAIVQSHPLPATDFAEGITVVGGRIDQLTWLGQHGYVYTRTTLTSIGQFSYITQGWGLTNDGHTLIMSDGSATLRYLDLTSYQLIRTLPVTLDGQPLTQLNELEYVDGLIWANVWHRTILVAIHPHTGKVVATVDLSALVAANTRADLPPFMQSEAVLNGIAYNPANNTFLVTGKLWSHLYAIHIG